MLVRVKEIEGNNLFWIRCKVLENMAPSFLCSLKNMVQVKIRKNQESKIRHTKLEEWCFLLN